MMLNYNNFNKLNEYVLSTEKYNDYYYLVLRLNENTLINLESMKFEGLKGISDNTNIINSFFDVRDILLVMKKQKVNQLNELKKIDYTNIDELCENNMALLKRLYHAADDYDIHSLLYQGMMKLSYINRRPTNFDDKIVKLYNKLNKYNYKDIRNFERDLFSVKGIKVESFKDLVTKTSEILTNYDTQVIEDIISVCILAFASMFKNEGEIIVKNNTFNIPPDSILFFKTPSKESYEYNEKLSLIHKHLPVLEKLYYVKLLPYIYGKYMPDTHKPVFAYIRYIDKLYSI